MCVCEGLFWGEKGPTADRLGNRGPLSVYVCVCVCVVLQYVCERCGRCVYLPPPVHSLCCKVNTERLLSPGWSQAHIGSDAHTSHGPPQITAVLLSCHTVGSDLCVAWCVCVCVSLCFCNYLYNKSDLPFCLCPQVCVCECIIVYSSAQGQGV